jgi:hypothetical protein
MMQKSLGCMRVVIALCVICGQNVHANFADDFSKNIAQGLAYGIVSVIVSVGLMVLNRHLDGDKQMRELELREQMVETDREQMKIKMEKHNLMMTNSLEKFRQEWCQKASSDEHSRQLCTLATRAVGEKYRDLVSTSEIIPTLENSAKNVTVAGI